MEAKLTPRELVVIGAICGDTIGSAYEFHPVKSTDFTLLSSWSRFTDDTVCTVAVADAIMGDMDFTSSLQSWCRKYPRAGYGGAFRKWIRSESPAPYNSWGNGSAMRVSPAGAWANSMEEALALAEDSAKVTHNHPEGIKGAQATAAAIYGALNGMSKEEIKNCIEANFGYDLSRDYAEIQPGYSFDVSCQGSVPEAIIAFLNGTDYESTVRLAVAMGGDADTMAAIAGGIAAAYYGEIPQWIIDDCMSCLPDDLRSVAATFNSRLKER